jgi:dTDP-4-dehydrorhamnose reductase
VKVLLTGSAGQLGRALTAAAPESVVLRALARAELDIADEVAVARTLREFAPQLVINAAGFTRVDEAERAPEDAARANTRGPQVLAASCRGSGAWLTHVSTDYVFDGRQAQPYGADALAKPLNTYGRTKLAGERAVAAELPHGSAVVRTSWLYSAQGGFVGRMLALMRARSQLSVVSDQIGVPTHAAGLAGVLWALSIERAPGLWHWCDSGVASWYDFAVAIAEEAVTLKLLPSAPDIAAVRGAEYPTAAARPVCVVLDKRATEERLGRRAPHWRAALRATLGGLRAPEGG